MPTIKQLPAATAIQATDLLPVSQGGATRALTIGGLLSSTQAAISLASGKLLGRVSQTAGGPEPIGLGTGLAVVAGSIAATAVDHLTLPQATALLPADEVIVNTDGAAKRLPSAMLRALFRAGSGVSIDSEGVVSAFGGSATGPATTDALGSVKIGPGLIVSDSGTIAPDPAVVAFRNALSTVALSGNYGDLSERPALGQAAGLDVGTTSGSVAAGDDPRIAGALSATAAATTYLTGADASRTYQTAQQVNSLIAGGVAANVSGVVAMSSGGTGATTAVTARGNLGLGNAAVANFGTTAGTVADGGAVAAALANAVTIGGSPVITPSAVAVMAAAGTGVSDVPSVVSAVNILGIVPAGTGVRLTAQQTTVVINRGGNPLKVFPPPGGTIEGGTADTAVQIPSGASATFVTADTMAYFAI